MKIDKIRVDNVDYNVVDSTVPNWARQEVAPTYDDTELRESINKINEDLGNTDTKVQEIENDIDTLEDTKADRTEIPDVSEFVKKTVDDLVNYYKKSETYTQSEVNQLIGAIKTTHFEIVQVLPQTGEENVIYLLPTSTSESGNIYEEYIYINGAYELIGTTKVDLSDYYTKEQIDTLLFDYITSNDLEQALQDYVTISMKYDFVKDGLVNNTNKLSDEEKLKIENWLGLSENYLTYYNATPYQVNGNYVPAHKKYVDEADALLRERISEIELSKFPNVTIFGTPTILQGQVSDFSLNDYLEFPFLVDFRGKSFEINFTFTTGNDIDNQQNILDSDFGLAFAIRNKHFVMALSYNGTSWATEQVGTLTLETQRTYRVKISWSGLVYRVQYSTDGGKTYLDDIQFGGTNYPYPKQMYIGVGKLAQNFFKGSINLNFADVIVEGNKIWTGVDDSGLALRADINLENISIIGEQKIKKLAGGLPNLFMEQVEIGEEIYAGIPASSLKDDAVLYAVKDSVDTNYVVGIGYFNKGEDTIYVLSQRVNHTFRYDVELEYYVEDNDEVIDFYSIKEKMGNLEDLETEDKSSLVGAINEINNKPSGGDLPYKFCELEALNFNGREFTLYTTTTIKTKIQEFLQECYDEKKEPLFVLKTGKSSFSSSSFDVVVPFSGSLTSNHRLSQKPTMGYIGRVSGIWAYDYGSIYDKTTKNYKCMMANLLYSINIQWSGDTLTVTSITSKGTNIPILPLDNNFAFTPTNDYHPSTKKYVDDTVASAVGNIDTLLQALDNGSGV